MKTYPGGIRKDFKIESIVSEKWYHVVGTYDGMLVKGYLDGELKNSKPASGIVSATTTFFGIGSSRAGTPGNAWPGKIDEVQIYNEALTLSQIQHIYASGLINRYLAYK